ncbi:MAG: fibrobacter succinogenes major paralogous domain-containing protein [Bacteroidales bacterium]|nr:fibrobacter succinogenes major paralogous domain-containing protein [Bacteroidales bacterium]
MKKRHVFLFLFCVLTCRVFSQTTDMRIELSATSVAATCQGNGEIHCSVTYSDGLDIEQLRYFYIPLSGIDSIMETSLPYITHLRPGNYMVKVSALCNTGLPQGDRYVVISDSAEILVESAYTIPSSGMIYNIYSHTLPYGIVPSMACEPTGKIQVKIQDGTFPYHLDIWTVTDTGLVFFRAQDFDTLEHFGADSMRYDYLHYYTIDSLPAGTYRIICHDGCGYHTPYLQAIVPKVKHYDHIYNHQLRNSSGDPESYNVITFKELRDTYTYVGHNDDYYRQTGRDFPYLYRFINPTIGTENDTTPWKQIPDFENAIFLYDTLSALHDYGELWERTVILQLQPPCGDTLFSYPFTIHIHGRNYIAEERETFNQTNTFAVFDYCGYTNGIIDYYQRTSGINVKHIYEACHSLSDSVDCKFFWGYTLSGGIPNSEKKSEYHTYITMPLRLHVINTTTDTVVTTEILEDFDYRWGYLILKDQNMHGDTLLIEITDYHHNPIISQLFKYKSDTTHLTSGGLRAYLHWVKWKSPQVEQLCPDVPHSIGIVYETPFTGKMVIGDTTGYIYDRDTICLIESPGNNHYNFTAIPNLSGNWTIVRERQDNHAIIEKKEVWHSNSNRMGMILTDTNLLPGRYVWIVRRDCPYNDTIVIDFDYNLPVVSESPQYIFDTTCTALNITPVKGQYSKEGMEVETFFQVTQEDSLTHSASAVHKGGMLSVGIPGTYRICMYSLPLDNGTILDKNPCFITDTVIHWQYQTVELDYIYGHVCNQEDSIGFVHVKGKHGVKPYSYKLFSNPNGQGEGIATNQTGVFDFVSVRFGQTVSVEITDACNAHFITNLTISDMDKIRKCWTDMLCNDITLPEGDTCHLYGLTLGDAHYHWHGPHGFSSHQRQVSFAIRSSADSGIYYLDIEGAGCGVMTDSVLVRVAARPCPQAIDYDGNIYSSIRIDGLCWTQTNLRSVHYSDGRPVNPIHIYQPSRFSPEETVDIFGMLYTWYATLDTGTVSASEHVQGICPEGWYLPTCAQYERLLQHGAMALRTPEYWIGNEGGTNETGFSALPAGFFNGARNRYENLLGETRFWALCTRFYSENAYCYVLNFFCQELSNLRSNPSDAYSVRCVLAE